MEFKFTCKWFEISFSGDPGFVQSQMDAYEPYVMAALEKVDKDPDSMEFQKQHHNFKPRGGGKPSGGRPPYNKKKGRPPKGNKPQGKQGP